MGQVNRQKPGDNSGYVYLMLGEDGLYKIGHSSWPQTRMNELRHNGWKASLVWQLLCVDQITTERSLHNRFRHLHVVSERFELSQEDVAWLVQQTEESICADYDHSRRFVRLKYRPA